MQTKYVILLDNVTLFMDIGRLTAFFTEHISAAVDLENLDACSPTSYTSTVWRLAVQLAGCLESLRGIVRIGWYGTYIVLKHSEVGRRQQCLGWRTFGHPMSRCGYSTEQLQGPGCVIATEVEVATVEDLAAPFHSFAGMHQVAS